MTDTGLHIQNIDCAWNTAETGDSMTEVLDQETTLQMVVRPAK
jgi:hypothetical protein